MPRPESEWGTGSSLAVPAEVAPMDPHRECDTSVPHCFVALDGCGLPWGGGKWGAGIKGSYSTLLGAPELGVPWGEDGRGTEGRAGSKGHPLPLTSSENPRRGSRPR